MATRTRQIKVGFWVIDLALTALIVFFLVRTVKHLVMQPAPAPTPLVESSTAKASFGPKIRPYSKYASLRSSTLFGALSSSSVAPKKVIEEKLPETTLELELLGTVAQSGSDPGFAIIRDKRKRTEDTYTVGDFIVGDAKVEEIRANEVVISRAGKRETLLMTFSGKRPSRPMGFGRSPYTSPRPRASSARGSGEAIRVVNDNLRYINRQKLTQEASQDLGSLLSQFRTSPNIVDNKPSGIKVDAIGSDPISARAGIKTGDIVKSINGVRVNSLNSIIEQAERFRNASEIRVVIERNGRHRTLVYKIR